MTWGDSGVLGGTRTPNLLTLLCLLRTRGEVHCPGELPVEFAGDVALEAAADFPGPDFYHSVRFARAHSCGLQVCGRRPVDLRTKGGRPPVADCGASRLLPAARSATARPETELPDDSCAASAR